MTTLLIHVNKSKNEGIIEVRTSHAYYNSLSLSLSIYIYISMKSPFTTLEHVFLLYTIEIKI